MSAREEKELFTGTFTALVTPFKDGGLDLEGFRRLIDLQLEAQVTGVVVCGCTGEAATLSDEERYTLIEEAVKRVAGNMLVVAGTGTNCTRTTIELTRRAGELGADAAMLITPYYNKPTQQGLYEHYSAVAEETSIPLILYNVPGRTGVRLMPDTVRRLAAKAGFIALKEAGGSVDVVSDLVGDGALPVLSGDDSLTLPMIAVGAVGVVSVVSNLVPTDVRDLVDHALRGEFTEAAAVHHRLLRLVRAAFVETNPAPIKAMLSMRGLISDETRLPLVRVSASNREAIESTMKSFFSDRGA